MGVDDAGLGQPGLGLDGVDVGFDDVDRPRVAALGRGVDQEGGVVAVEQLVGEVDAPDAVVDDLDALGYRRAGQEAAGDLGAEPVVALEDVADAGHEDPPGPAHRWASSRSAIGSTSSMRK